MNYDKIRSMSDEELKWFLKGFAKRGSYVCQKCKGTSNKVIKIENKDTMQTKALCGLCEDCYMELLEYLGTYDLGWDI